LWTGARGDLALVAANYAQDQGQCYIRLPVPELAHQTWRVQDQLSGATYERAGDELVSQGLYLDVPEWQCHVFTIQPSAAPKTVAHVKQ
jgi:hypothetical protein